MVGEIHSNHQLRQNNVVGPVDNIKETPKKPLPPPFLDSPLRRNLHKELVFNQRIGKNVLEKPELTKVLEKRLDEQKKKDLMNQKINRRNSFEKKLEAQALKLEKNENVKNKEAKEEPETPEFIKIRAKLSAIIPNNKHA